MDLQVQESNAYQALSLFSQDYVTKQVQQAKLEYKHDSLELTNTVKQEPISFKEGVGLYADGFINKLKNIVTSIIKHPIKTAAIVLGTTAILSALPLIGISTVAAGSALALLYAGIAVGKTTYHTAKFVKNNKNENYDEARKNLGQMGGDTVDLALTLPFAPKAIKNVKDFVKFGKIGINHELINEINTSKGIRGKFKAIKNGNIKITEDINFKKATSDEYLNNILEVNARKAGENPEGFIGDYKKVSEISNELPVVKDTFIKNDAVAIIQGDSVAD